MANINDYKIVKQHSLRYFERMEIGKPFDEIDKQRLGFYLLILECVTGIKEKDVLTDMIIDCDFCKKIYGVGNDDLGIDAVNIDEDNKKIQLFNFKYREKFNENNSTKECDVYDSTRFFTTIKEEKTEGVDDKTKEKLEEIIQKLNSDEIYEIELYMVANVNNEFSTNSALETFKDHFGLVIHNITLDDIIGYLTEQPSDGKACVIVDANSLLTYETSSYLTSKSFLLKLSLADLVRITCKDASLREAANNQDSEKLRNAKLEMSLLYENVRGYLGNTKYNKNIVKTIKDKPEMFFMFNNGITLVANTITSKPINGNKKYEITMEGVQIVNGGQTIRSVYKYCEDSFDQERLEAAEILVRLFQTDNDEVLKNDIAEYTNSQNAINSADLKSVNKIQRQIEAYLAEKNILYIRKSGDVGKDDTKYKFSISKEKLAQIIYSAQGYPVRATNKKTKLFEDYYKDIFPDDMDVESIEPLINEYVEIKEKYDSLGFDKYEQKYLYVIYIIHKDKSLNIDRAISILEDTLNTFEPEKEISKSRKLLKISFNQKIDDALEKEGTVA